MRSWCQNMFVFQCFTTMYETVGKIYHIVENLLGVLHLVILGLFLSLVFIYSAWWHNLSVISPTATTVMCVLQNINLFSYTGFDTKCGQPWLITSNVQIQVFAFNLPLIFVCNKHTNNWKSCPRSGFSKIYKKLINTYCFGCFFVDWRGPG